MARLEETKRKKNAIHPQSRFGRLSQRWSSGDFWWHRCGRRRSSGSPPSAQTPSFPSESSFITLTWETQRGFFHPRALMFSLSETSRGCFSFFLVISSSLGLSLPFASLLSSPFFPGYAFLSLLRGSSRTIRPISSDRFWKIRSLTGS